jgi:hypothetical protein
MVDGNAWLRAVACAGRDNVWAVGGKEHDDGSSGPFILHFDGSAWAAVEPPEPFAAPTGAMEAVTVLPGEAAWAAGTASPWWVSTGYMLPLVMSTERHH